MKGRRVMWEWRVRLWVDDDATPDQEDALLEYTADLIDSGQIEYHIENILSPLAGQLQVKVEEM